ncbi:MAG: TlpA family protein disulfide reductase [Saprospiraceae bacterium]
MKYIFVLASLLFTSCLVVNTTFDKLPPGPYRGIFYLDGRLSQTVEPDDVAANFDLEDINRGELPINLELSYTADSSLHVVMINGEERIEVPDVEYERLLETAQDSITIRFPLIDAYITGYHEAGIIEGSYVDETRNGYRIPFAAFYGLDHRFTHLRKTPTTDLSGRWDVQFSVEDTSSIFIGIGEFEQNENELRGTFLTTTGDYRYLEGTVQADRFYMSTFDGAHVFLFTGKVLEDGSLLGIFRSGNHYSTIWKAQRNASAKLPDPTQETSLLNPEASIQIEALDPASMSSISVLDQPALAGKLKVISLMGTWCPNCMDEARFLDSLRQTVSSEKVAFVGLAFEKFRDTTRAVGAIKRFGESLKLGYPTYLAGSSVKSEATKQLGFLDQVRSFPTLLIVDERNRVRYVHTGFTGPATSEYGPFTTAFAKTLQTLIAE